MKNKEFHEMSHEELRKKKKSLASTTGFLTGLLIILLVAAIYICIRKGFTPLIIIPFALSPIIIVNYKKIKEIKEELKKRL